MKLLVVLCLVALAAAAEYPAGSVPTAVQLTQGLTRVYRRLLHSIAPKQVELQDAFDIQWRYGIMASIRDRSAHNGTFDNVEKPTYSHIYSLINPEQKGTDGYGQWIKNTASEIIVTYHYGDAVKLHMLTEGGIHKEFVLGNPLDHDHKNAKFVVVLPKSTYCTFESLSEDEATFLSYFSVPAWSPESHFVFSLAEMKTKFSDHADLFRELAKPGVHHPDHHDIHDGDYHSRDNRHGDGHGSGH